MISGSSNGTNGDPKGVVTQSGECQSQVLAPTYGSVGGIPQRTHPNEKILTTGNNQERFLVKGSAREKRITKTATTTTKSTGIASTTYLHQRHIIYFHGRSDPQDSWPEA